VLFPEEMVTSLLIEYLLFGTRFLIILLYPLLLPVLNVNSVSFTLINRPSDSFSPLGKLADRDM